MLRRLFRLAPWVVGALLLGFFPPHVAESQLAGGVCLPNPATYTATYFPTCGANGGMNTNVIGGTGPVLPTPMATSLSLATAGTPGPFISVPLTKNGYPAGGALCWHKGLTGSTATVYTTVSSDPLDAYANWNNMPAQSVAGVVPSSNVYNITVDGLYWIPGFGAAWLNFNTGIAGTGTDAISCQVMPWGYQPQSLDSAGMANVDVANQSVNLTVVPGPTDAAHYPYVHPTAMPTGFASSQNTSSGLVIPILGRSVGNVIGTAAESKTLVTHSGTTSIWLTYINMSSIGSSAVHQLVYGTGTNCGTGTVVIAQYSGVSGRTLAMPTQYQVPSGNDVCSVTSGTITNYSATITYEQF